MKNSNIVIWEGTTTAYSIVQKDKNGYFDLLITQNGNEITIARSQLLNIISTYNSLVSRVDVEGLISADEIYTDVRKQSYGSN